MAPAERLENPQPRHQPGSLNAMTDHLHGTLDDVTARALRLARAGDHRARPARINGNTAILTPHRTESGHLDAADLAAQAYALALGLSSDDGHYTDGYFTADGLGHYVPAPDNDDQPHPQDSEKHHVPGLKRWF